MIKSDSSSKRYGIEIRMPDGDPFRAVHLLGDSWTGQRWFDSKEQRDQALMAMRKQPGNYRKGDLPSVEYREINPDQ
ncbi:MAG: hypothetical protein KTR32_17950 [Granulosicoccus sp.]|nr:hypothetical protein [Granulosicoccus sp.]